MFNLIPYSRKNGDITRKDDWFGIDRFFDDFFRDPFFTRVSAMTTPIRADVKETEKEYIVEAELPGVNKEDIIIDLHDDVLNLVSILRQKMKRTMATFRNGKEDLRTKLMFNIKNEDGKLLIRMVFLLLTYRRLKGKRNKKINIE